MELFNFKSLSEICMSKENQQKLEEYESVKRYLDNLKIPIILEDQKLSLVLRVRMAMEKINE